MTQIPVTENMERKRERHREREVEKEGQETIKSVKGGRERER